jgi:hypothetical protein
MRIMVYNKDMRELELNEIRAVHKIPKEEIDIEKKEFFTYYASDTGAVEKLAELFTEMEINWEHIN